MSGWTGTTDPEGRGRVRYTVRRSGYQCGMTITLKIALLFVMVLAVMPTAALAH
jgi:hypothetical protein